MVEQVVNVGLASLAYIGLLLTLISTIIQIRYLHEEPGSEKRRPRSIIFALILAGVLIAFVGTIRSQWAQNIMSTTIQTQGKTIAALQIQEDDAMKQLRLVLDSRASTQKDINEATRHIQNLETSDVQLRNSVTGATIETQTLAQQAADVVKMVAKSNLDINKKLAMAQEAAREAQIKARVFHLSKAAKGAITAAFQSTTGRVSVACSPGIEPACTDLVDALKQSRWTVSTLYGGAFYGGFDQQFPDQNSELTIFYSATASTVVENLAIALRAADLTVALRRNPGNPGEPDIGISFRFIR